MKDFLVRMMCLDFIMEAMGECEWGLKVLG